MIYGTGPVEQWEAELNRVNKEGLVNLVERLFWACGYSPENRLASVRKAKTIGKYLAIGKRTYRLLADPLGETRRMMKRQAAAKKAARKRKKAKA